MGHGNALPIIGNAWAVPYKNLTGKDRGTPWSAAFVSFCFKEAGAGEQFPYSPGHATYINAAIRNRKDAVIGAPLVAYQLKEYSLKPGDLIGYWRGEKAITFENASEFKWYQSHTDIVIHVTDKFAYTIGGNVQNSVTRRQVRLNSAGELIDTNKKWFVAISNNL